MRWIPILILALLPWTAAEPTFVVNGKRLEASEVQMLRELAAQYGVEPVPGRYWYDPISGLYGAEGGPTAGQTLPQLPIGGPLRADASGGGSGVWVNGREMHRDEVTYLSQCTQVIPGRYWLDAYSNGGLEGGPMQFNLRALCNQARQRMGSRFGTVISDGTTSGAFFRNVDGSYTSVSCGPDGGCIY